MNKEEYIICAAIHFPDGNKYAHQPRNIESGIVICGRRHHNIFVVAKECNLSHIDSIQGFLTSKDRFLNREDAAQLAFGNGQIDTPVKELFSEDIY